MHLVEALSFLLRVREVTATGYGMGHARAEHGEMTDGARASWWRAGAIASNLAIALFFGSFAEAHLRLAWETGSWATIGPMVAQELLLVILFLTRRLSLATSSRPWDWAVGLAGTIFPFLFEAETSSRSWPLLGAALQFTGFTTAILATLSLGRSMGIIAANRGVKTGGLYRIVRHPMYSGYLLTYSGYLAAYPTLPNAALALLTVVAIDQRARAEERFLGATPAYAALLQRTRWRFVPYIY
jgi:protein-S-isoprenylcysteine O-methyltransferase Ste14